MIGDKYSLVGTNTIFEITGETPSYWEMKIYDKGTPANAQLGVLMTKRALLDSISDTPIIKKTLTKL